MCLSDLQMSRMQPSRRHVCSGQMINCHGRMYLKVAGPKGTNELGDKAEAWTQLVPLGQG